MHWFRLIATLLVGSIVVSCGATDVVGSSIVGDRSSPTSAVPLTIRAETAAAEVWPTDDEIRRAFTDLVVGRRDCGRRPTACDESSLAVDGSDVHRRLVDLMLDRRTHDIVASDRGEFRFRIDAVDVLGPDRARVLTCIADDTVLVQNVLVDGASPVLAVVDDSLFSSITWWTIERHDGRWLWAREEALQWTIGADLCVD